MKKNKILIASAVTLLLIVSGVYFFYGYLFKESRNIISEKPALSISAAQLAQDYASNGQKSDSLYLNKTIEITGIVTKVNDSSVTLANNVFCLFNDKIKKDLLERSVAVKGKCIGYDDLFQEVKLDQCSINKQNN